MIGISCYTSRSAAEEIDRAVSKITDHNFFQTWDKLTFRVAIPNTPPSHLYKRGFETPGLTGALRMLGAVMRYLIKDLAKISGFSPARLRKWQQRHSIFAPETGDNGYNYYTSDDLLVLNHVKHELEQGRTLRDVIQPGRDELLAAARDHANVA